MRELATIQVIKNLTPITGADRIELATILGWNVVVKKGEFEIGDLCVYFEIDSILPDREWSQFLKDKTGKIGRLKTIKLKGQISQGLALPTSILPKEYNGCLVDIKVGKDVTETLEVKKWEPPQTVFSKGQPLVSSKIRIKYPRWIPKFIGDFLKSHFNKTMKKYFGVYIGESFPHFISKTDETRVQVLQPLLDKYKGMKCVATEKLDGSSITIYWYNGIFGVCSRNYDLQENKTNNDGGKFWEAARRKGLEKHMGDFVRQKMNPKYGLVLQGELIGPGIQGNKYKLTETDIRVFNVYSIEEQKYLPISICDILGVQTVPVLQMFELPNEIDTLVEMSKGNSQLANVPREGIVIRPLEEIKEYELVPGKLVANRFSFKVINPEFSLKYEE